ncbi:ankyrin repeat-containing domain protein [Xylariaceae sp. AK1471]|nr:ankyrin repeat-containing domain protein [Xylariaceae sp. AK1471]
MIFDSTLHGLYSTQRTKRTTTAKFSRPSSEDRMATIQETARKHFYGVMQLLRGPHGPWDTNSNGMTALHRAAQKGDTGPIARLLEEYPVTAEDNYGRVAMHYAAEGGYEEIVKALVETTDVNTRDKLGRTALHWAAENNHVQVAKLLLVGKKANADLQDRSKQTALSRAAWRGWNEIVLLLLENGAAHHLPDQNGNMALHLAADEEHEAITTLLFTRVIKDNKADSTYGSVAEKVLKKYWNDTLRSWDGQIMCWAAINGHKQVIQMLLEKGVQVNDRLKNDVQIIDRLEIIKGWTALETLAAKGALEAVNHLLEVNADPNAAAASEHGRTALQAAAEGGYLEVVNRLLEVNADPNGAAAEWGGRTAL